VYDYSPRNDDEMCLVAADKVEVMEQCVVVVVVVVVVDLL